MDVPYTLAETQPRSAAEQSSITHIESLHSTGKAWQAKFPTRLCCVAAGRFSCLLHTGFSANYWVEGAFVVAVLVLLLLMLDVVIACDVAKYYFLKLRNQVMCVAVAAPEDSCKVQGAMDGRTVQSRVKLRTS